MTSAEFRVLLVEDGHDQAMRDCLAEALSDSGAAFDHASSAEARRKLAARTYDILLLDDYPGADNGLSLLRQLRSEGIDIPAILLTNQGRHEVAVEAMKAGASDYLLKENLAPAPLAAAVRHAVELCRSRSRQVQAEKALHESEARYRRVFDQALIGNYITTPGGQMLACNAAFARILGFDSVEDALAAKAYNLYPDAASRERVLDRLRETGQLAHFEAEQRRPDGTPVHVLLNAIAIKDASGAMVEMQGSILDITEWKRAEKDLVESNRFNAEIIASVHEAIVACDRDLRCVLWNRFAEELSGIPAKDLIGRRVLEVFPGLAKHGVDGLLRRALAGEIVSTPDVSAAIPGTDKTIWTTGTLVPRRNAEGEIIGVIGAIHDITQHKRADDALGQSEEQLRQSQKMEAVGRLAGGVAHDFNNLLGVIMGYAELLLRGRGPDHPDVPRIEHIHKAAERAAGLTRQLLAFSRKQVLDPKVVSINAIVEDTQKMLRRLIGEDLEMTVSLEPRLDLVKADPGQVEQVLMNLAVNARDAMPKGGRLVLETANVVLDETYVRRHAGVRAGRYVMVAVSDTGVGMDAETRSRVFEPFFTTKEKGKGTGLGLSTVFGIVQQSGGHVTVYSEPGMGSTFKVYLPCVEEDARPTRADAAREPIPGGTGTILLVEDEASLRAIIGELLRDAGYTVTEAASPEEALALAQDQREPIHLLLTDVVMPKMNGRALARALARVWPRMKVLFMSGYTDDAIVQHGVLEPGIAFLEKPFTADALARKVRDVLGAA
jgi:PAS domain S-box-containing protein